MRIMYDSLITPRNRRAVAEIRENVSEKCGRNVLSRLVHAKSDKDAIAAWNFQLDRVQNTFNVCSVGSVLLSLISLFQTELTLSTQLMVSDLHRDRSAGQEVANTQRPSVSATFCPPTTEHSPPPRLQSG